MEYCKYCKKRVLTSQWDLHIKSQPHKEIEMKYYNPKKKYNRKKKVFSFLFHMIK